MEEKSAEKANIVCDKMKTFLNTYCNSFKTYDDQNKYYCEAIARMTTKICYGIKR